jgi:hypothetical protein
MGTGSLVGLIVPSLPSHSALVFPPSFFKGTPVLGLTLPGKLRRLFLAVIGGVEINRSALK